MYPTIHKGEIGVALTSGYLVNVKALSLNLSCFLATPCSASISAQYFAHPLTAIPLIPCARGLVEVIYLSVKRLVMMLRQEALSPWHWMLQWGLHEVHGPGAMINVKCNKRPVNKTEQCQSHCLLIDFPSRSYCLCVCAQVFPCMNSTLSSFRIKAVHLGFHRHWLPSESSYEYYSWGYWYDIYLKREKVGWDGRL